MFSVVHRRPGYVRNIYRAVSTLPNSSAIYLDTSRYSDPAVNTSPENLTPSQSKLLDSALRVDQAGELAANWIYRGQMAVLRRDPHTQSIIQNMWDQEKKHLAVMNKLQVQHRARPTAFWEVAKVIGFGLGAMTGIMGKEAAMACTEAVETVIGEHYDEQLDELDSLPASHPSILILKKVIREFRDDELEHLDTAIDHNSQRAPSHALLTTVVSNGCKVAIALCKTI